MRRTSLAPPSPIRLTFATALARNAEYFAAIGNGAMEMSEEQMGGAHGTSLCVRCGDQPACVIDGSLALCGGCFHSQVLRQRRRAAMARMAAGNPSLEFIHKIERIVWKQIAPCACLDEES